MGTRHLVGVVIDGQHKVAQYGQWDGYPSGQGADVSRFIMSLTPESLAAFSANVRACRFASREELEALGDRWLSVYPHMSRDTGADILSLVAAEPLVLCDAWSFGANSLFCEYAYVLDLDREVLEFYEGFQKKAHGTGRFADIAPDGDGYWQCRLAAEYPFAAIDADTPEAMESLVKDDE